MVKNSKLTILHRYYKISHFYEFIKKIIIKGSIIILLFLGVLMLVDFFFIDINSLLKTLVASYSPYVIFLIFFISESFLGLLPPEFFIAWSSKSLTPWSFLFILASLSYIGGIISYLIGRKLYLIPAIKDSIENKISKHIVNLRKWGGLFVFLGAMFPIPHAIISLASGLIKFNFKHYLLWSLFRFVRFVLYALVIFKIF